MLPEWERATIAETESPCAGSGPVFRLWGRRSVGALNDRRRLGRRAFLYALGGAAAAAALGPACRLTGATQPSGTASPTPFLPAAIASPVDYFITLDRQHFLDHAKMRQVVPFVVGTPEDFLAWFRNRLAAMVTSPQGS